MGVRCSVLHRSITDSNLARHPQLSQLFAPPCYSFFFFLFLDHSFCSFLGIFCWLLLRVEWRDVANRITLLLHKRVTADFILNSFDIYLLMVLSGSRDHHARTFSSDLFHFFAFVNFENGRRPSRIFPLVVCVSKTCDSIPIPRRNGVE
jgi:hypothetical protein